MKKRRYFSSLKLSYKFNFLIMAIIVFPLVILSILFFRSIRDARIKEKMKSVEISFAQNYEQTQKNVEIIQMATQVMVNSHNFWSYIEQFGTTESDSDTESLIRFYQTEIKALEKLININPYLSQIRVYTDIDGIPEMMPVLYKKDRMRRLVWAKEDNIPSGSWFFDYEDELFPAYSIARDRHLVAQVTNMPLENGTDAIIEVSTNMDLIFPEIYSSNEQEWTFFVDGDENIFYDWSYESKWLNNVEEVQEKIPESHEQMYYAQMTLDGEPVIVCYKQVKALGGALFRIVSLEKEYISVTLEQNIFWICFIIIVIILLLFSDKMVKIILKQFYVIMDTVRKVQKGNLEVRVEENPGDEIGELGEQINKMMERITLLMEENIRREILVKDSEIRALQNQINAHFIYNVLETIKMMAEMEKKYDISDAVTALGKLLRYSMKWVSKNVTVAEEIDYIKNYLALMNLRFDYEIYLSLNIPELIYKQEIPKMSLQPIIENAIYHGIEEISEDTSIYIKGILHEDCFTIEITDSGKGMSAEQVQKLQKKIDGELESGGKAGHGIGLKNVKDRIKISFGEDYGIRVASKIDCYTKVIVKIPLGECE